MEITIDEHRAQLKKLKSFHNGSYGASINFALDTIRKYQKIEQIISDGYLQGKSSGEMLLGIKGVMNGNDDC